MTCGEKAGNEVISTVYFTAYCVGCVCCVEKVQTAQQYSDGRYKFPKTGIENYEETNFKFCF